MERIGVELVIYQNTVVGTQITDDFDVLNWFQMQQMQFPILKWFAYIIHSIIASQTENERGFSLSGIYIASGRANIYVEIIYYLLFINRNSTALGRNRIIDVFGGSLDAMANIVDEMESNTYASADDSDTK